MSSAAFVQLLSAQSASASAASGAGQRGVSAPRNRVLARATALAVAACALVLAVVLSGGSVSVVPGVSAQCIPVNYAIYRSGFGSPDTQYQNSGLNVVPQVRGGSTFERNYQNQPYGGPCSNKCLGLPAGMYSCFPVITDLNPTLPTGNRTALFPYGPRAGDSVYPGSPTRNDDGFAGPLSLLNLAPDGKDYSFKFYGTLWNEWYLGNNGILSFGSGVWSYSPQQMPVPGFPAMIAVFWADVDTSCTEGGTPWYRVLTRASNLAALQNYTTELRGSFLGLGQYVPTLAIVVTWDAVGVFPACSGSKDYLNTFQVVLLSDGFQSFCLFNYGYKAQQWQIGSASGGAYPQVGFQDGAGNNYNAAATTTIGMRDLWFLSRAQPAYPGRQVHRVDGLVISQSPTYLSPDPRLSAFTPNFPATFRQLNQAVGDGCTTGTASFNTNCKSYSLSLTPSQGLSVTPVEGVSGQYIRCGKDVGSAAPVTSGTATTPLAFYSSGGQFFCVVLAPDTITETTYSITITRLPNTDSQIASMAMSVGGSPVTFDQGVWALNTYLYSKTVASNVGLVDFLGQANDQLAAITMRQYGPHVNVFTANSVVLAPGTNVFTFNCSAEDRRYWRLYNVTITRQLSTDARLSSISAQIGGSPVTVTNTSNSFYITVGTADSAITITGVTFYSQAFIGFPSPKTITTGNRVFSPLAYYTNNYQIEVQAESGAVQQYNLYITRPPSANADIASLVLTTDLGDTITIPPTGFSSATISYTVPVNQQVPSVFAVATVADPALYQGMTLNSATLGSATQSNAIPLAASLTTTANTVLTFIVTAQSGAQKTYTVTLVRAAPVRVQLTAGACVQQVFAVRRNEYITYRVETQGQSEVLHVDATSNISPGGAPDLWIRKALLPNPAGSTGNGFITQSTPASATPNFSSATVINATADIDWFVMFSPGSGTANAGPFTLTVTFCQYVAQTLLLGNAVSATVARNRWQFFTTQTNPTDTLPGVQYTLQVTSAATDKSQQFLRSWSRVFTSVTPADPGQFFGPIDNTKNPSSTASAPQAIFSAATTAPAASTRLVFAVYAPTADVSAVTASGAATPVNFDVKVLPVTPVIASVSPRNGPTTGGNQILITLAAGTSEPRVSVAVGAAGSATIGGLPCTALTYDAQSRMLCTVPAGMGQNLQINVTLYGQKSLPFVQTYSYDPPTLSTPVWAVAPTAGGANLTVNGNNFGVSPVVTVGGFPCAVLYTNPAQSQLICSTPAGEGTVQIVVSANGQASTNTKSYTYDAPTLIQQFAANRATAGGNPITIWGTNFGRNQTTGNVQVTIGNNACPVTQSNQTVIICTLPAGSGQSQAIVVTVATVPNGASSVTFTYQGPVITWISPSPVPTLSTTLVIFGAQFGPLTSSMVVNLLGGTCNVITRNDTFIICTTPTRSVGLPADATVTAGGQQSNAVPLAWEKPIVTSISPQTVGTAGGDLVLISGRNLYSAAGDNKVRFNGVDINPTAGSNSSIVRFTVPTNNPAGTYVPLLIFVGQQLSDAGTYVNFTKPNIGSVTFNSGSGPYADGTATATVTGTNFGPTGIVQISTGQLCTSSSWLTGQVICQFPIGVGAVNVWLVVAGQMSNVVGVTYLAPQVTLLNPADPQGVSTAGGDTVQITGRNFGATQGSGTVTIRLGNGLTAPCTVVAWSDPSISCTAPVGNGTNLLVTVTQAGATGTRLGLTYSAPSISTVTASSFPTAGGSTLILTGTSFDSAGVVTVNGTNCPLISWNNAAGQIQCTLPSGGGANVAVTIATVAGKTSAPALIAYDVPSILSIIPATLTAAGQIVTIVGTNLGSKSWLATAAIDGVTTGNVVTFNNHTHMIFTLGTTPQSASAAITVTYAGRASAGYTVGLSAPTISGLNPPNGPTGPANSYQVTIQGDYFGDGTRATTVNFGTKTATIVPPITPNQIVVWAPEFVDSQLVQVTVGTQNSNTRAFQYDRPRVTGATPSTNLATSAPLTVVNITGTSFGAASSVVLLNGVAVADASIAFRTHTLVSFIMPPGSGAGIIVAVKQSSQTSTETAVTLSYKGPNITSITPATGPTDGCTNYCLNVIGTGFGPGGAQAGTVSVGGQACAVTTTGYTDSLIRCNLPAGSGRLLDVIVNVNGVPSTPFKYSYTAPVITGITPPAAASPAGGSLIVIAGSNMGQTGTVNVNGTVGACAVSNPAWWTSTSVQCVMPAGFNYVSITVTTGSQTSNSLGYSYAPPTLDAAPVPANGPTAGGTVIVMGGNNLGTTAGVITIGSLPCTPINTGWTNTRIECVTPAGPGGPDSVITVIVGNPSGQRATSAFKWDKPVVYAVEPQPSPTAAGLGTQPASPLWVRGTNFGDNTYVPTVRVNFGGPVSSTVHNHTHLRIANVPNGVGQNLAVQVQVSTGALSDGPLVLSYRAPTITSITTNIANCAVSGNSIADCTTAGLFQITINGFDLGDETSPLVLPTINVQQLSGPSACDTVSAPNTDGTRIVCRFPAGVSSGLPLTVTVQGQVSNAVLVGYRRPTFFVNTLRFNPGAGGGNLAGVSIGGGQQIYLGGSSLDAKGTTQMKFGTAGVDNTLKEFTCTVSSPQAGSVLCTLPNSGNLPVGAGLTFVYFDGQQWSADSPDTLSFATPVLVPNTIQRGTSGSPGTSVTGQSSAGEFIDFDAQNVGNVLAYLDAYYDVSPANGGTFNDPAKQCSPLSIVSYTQATQTTRLRCRTQSGDGGPYVFKVKALNVWTAAGTDTYTYPTAPKITSVYGSYPCVNSTLTNSTSNCPTTGAVKITIGGTNFQSAASDNSVLVGTSACLITSASSTQIVCTLPAGVGQNVPVTVYSALYASQPVNKLSYAKAIITSVTGCTAAGCTRTGGNTLAITGTGFGPSGAFVFVGASRCLPLTHVSDSSLTCTAPAGTGLNTTVLVIQSSGTLSANNGLVSYAQCGTGSYQASFTDYGCTPCANGTYADQTGLLACKPCPVGSATALPGQVTCAPCAIGWFAGTTGLKVCTQCAQGSYTSSTGQGACQQCPAQSFAAGLGNTGCTPCPAGQSSQATGAGACTNCTAGYFTPSAGAGDCQACAPGTYNTGSGNTGCIPCGIGKVQANPGSTTCVPCTAGYIAAIPGQVSCVACDQGSFAGSGGLGVCTPCDPGSWSKKSGSAGAVACTDCLPGTYLDVGGQADCIQCPKGRVSAGSKATACLPCALGKIASDVGLSVCTNCTAGTVASRTGLDTCEVCPTGKYSSGPGASACVDCEVGKYNPLPGQSSCTLCGVGGAGRGVVGPGTGQAACVPCSPGYAMNNTGQTVCTPCAVGTFATSAQATGCTACSPGYFAPTQAAAVCQACPAGTYSAGFGSTQCLPCAPGNFSSAQATVCTQCPAGQFAPQSGSATCQMCPIGKVSRVAGSSQCVDCQPGEQQPLVGATVCVACVKGRYTLAPAQAACFDCPIGSITPNANMSSCAQCAIGRFAPQPGSSVCQACAPGTATNTQGQASCPSCVVGTAANAPAQSVCSACLKGSYASGSNSSACQPCAAGTYAALDGAITCTPCPVGQFQDATGKTLCKQCSAGFVQPLPGQASCSACLAGTVQANPGQVSCTQCPSGQFAAGLNNTQCKQCLEGTANPTPGAASCPSCTAGKFIDLKGAAACRPCPSGFFQPNVTTYAQCTACPAGSARAEEGAAYCDACPVGKFAPSPGSGQCQLCPAGSYADRSGMSQCTSCPAGSACPTGSVNPTACLAPNFSPSTGQAVCTQCPSGQFINVTAATTCFLCEQGKFAGPVGALPFNGATVCTQCDAGKFASSVALPQCADCPSGSFAANMGSRTCAQCPIGFYYQNTGASVCTPAPEGYAVASPGQSLPTLCSFGTYSVGLNNTQCKPCNAGQYQNYGSATSVPNTCPGCPAGSYSPAPGQQNCLLCDAGTFSNATGLTACYPAPVGRYAPGGAQSSTPCNPGQYAATAGSASCLPCPARTYADNIGTGQCTPCQNKTFGNETGMSQCRQCPVGTFNDVTGQLACKPCQPGQYQTAPGADACIPCPAGSFSASLSAGTCTQCAPGYYTANTGSVQCLECPVGSFSTSFGATVCELCDPGSYQNDTAAQGCVQCEPGKANNFQGALQCTACKFGTVAPGPGLLLCLQCDAGKYMPTEGQQVCTECGTGRFNPTPGAEVCTPCPKGTYMPYPGSSDSTCLPCDPGTYQSAQDQDHCLPCAAGKIAPANRTEECTICPAGTFNSNLTSDRTACTTCPSGSFQPQQGQYGCIQCDIGKSAPIPGQSICTDCPTGRIANVTGMASCDFCDYGLYQSEPGKTACLACGGGTYADQKMLTSCTLCQPGTASNDTGRRTACDACPTGTYAGSQGQQACTPCETGKYNNLPPTLIGALGCSPCPQGRFSNTTGFGATGSATEFCLQCDIGRYNADTGKSFCDLCGNGTYNGQIGQKLCTTCSSGTYAPREGLVECLECSKGRFTNENTGRSVCSECAAGKHASGTRTETCQQCSAGFFANGTGFIDCLECDLGKFTGIVQSQGCGDCPVGRYQDELHGTKCKSCNPGSANNKTGQPFCPECPKGYYQDSSDALTCIACPIGKFVNVPGKDACVTCPAGYYADREGSTECLACAPGYFQSEPEQATCIACPKGQFATGAATRCITCGDRQVAPREGTFSCYACDTHASTEDHQTCMCDDGYAAQYTYNNETGNQEAHCTLCNEGAYCPRGTEFASMNHTSGYWCAENGVYYRCLIETDCPAGTCASALCASGQETCDTCANSRTGPLCAYCLDGWTADSQGHCNPCSSDKTNSYIYTIAIVVGFLILLLIACYIMLRSSSQLMDIAAREDEKMRLKAEGYIQNFNEGFLDDQWRFGRYITLAGAPPPKPDFTFKLKILLGFVQIITNLAVGLNIEWPTAFKAFLQAMNPANLDFVKFSSVDCIRRPTYYDQLILFALVPPALIILLIVFYFIPQSCRNLSSSNEGRAWRKRVRRNFWKLLLFLLFLVYPTVSATVLRLYVCIDVEGVSYLRADLTTQCHTDEWNRAAYGNLILVFLYPIMIPVFFLLMLTRYRKRLDQSGVRAELGFLYDGFERSFYLFELVDMVHKLGITSLVAFLPDYAQLRVAMTWVTLYLVIILWRKPYIRKGDDILHLFVQIEVMLLLMAGWVFTTLSGPDSLMDAVLSVVLIAAVCGLFLYFLLSALNVFIKWLRHTECAQNWSCLRVKEESAKQTVGGKKGDGADPNTTAGDGTGAAKKPAKKKLKAKDLTIAGEMKRVYRIDRHTLREHGRVATARGHDDRDEVAMQRNALWGDAELAKASFAELRGASSPSSADLVRSPRATTGTGPAPAAGNVMSPRRALLAHKLGDNLPAGTPVPVPQEQLLPLTPGAPEGGVEMSSFGAAPQSPQAAAAGLEPLFSTGAHPSSGAAAEPASNRNSTADLAQPLGTTPAGAPAAIELQAVNTAAQAPIQLAEIAPVVAPEPVRASVVAEPIAVPQFAPIAALPVEGSGAAAAAAPSAVADVPSVAPLPALASFEPIEPIAAAGGAAPASAVADVPSVVAAVPTFEPLPAPKEL